MAGAKRKATLTRAKNRMPESIRRALAERGLLGAFHARPAYQQNDYLGWIAKAVRDSTKQKRVDQMLDELAGGELYMNMRWTPGKAR
jgi:uncharacterized protein YdeI (YjbR/CyaY-like superfamily)